jgi:uncharacterized glyoxalase superfamily protein PhnB
MSQELLLGHQRIVPYLHYENTSAAIDFLCRVFGFKVKHRSEADDGTVSHAEIEFAGNVVMLGTPRDSNNQPKDLSSLRSLEDRGGVILCYVDDVNAHYAHAKAEDVKIIAPLEDKPYGDRVYAAVDPEGHQWYFATRMKAV